MPVSTLAREQLAKLLVSDEAFATSLVAICIDSFGIECFEWEPDMLLSELEEEFGVRLLAVNRDKICAFISALTTDTFYRDPLVFWHTANALSGVPVNFQSPPEDLDPHAAAWACVEITLNDMADGKSEQPSVSGDVAGLVGVALHNSGFMRAPTFLKFALLPGPAEGLDGASTAAREGRDRELADDLEKDVRERLERLDHQVTHLPLHATLQRSVHQRPLSFLGSMLASQRGQLGRSAGTGAAER